MRINVKNSTGVTLPVRATSKSTAYDVVAISDPEIVGEQYPDGGWKRIDYIQYDTGVIAAPQNDNYGHSYHILIHPRSSVSKYNLVLANGIGLIDNDYRKTLLARYKYIWQPEDMWWGTEPINTSEARKTLFGKPNMERIYKKGDRVAQLVVEPTTDAEWVFVQDVDVTERTGGFGSTDVIPITNRVAADEVKRNKPPEKTYESHTDILEHWKKLGGSVGHPATYETLIKEREKHIGNQS